MMTRESMIVKELTVRMMMIMINVAVVFDQLSREQRVKTKSITSE